MTLRPGTRLGPYEIVALLGAGGMGEVYRARDERLGRDVAIKVLPAEFAADPERLRRFEQEARAVAGLSHPNILALYDIGAHEGSPFIVSELLEGETLRDRLRAGGLTVRKAVETAVQIAQGLAAAHEKGIVHRDLKPANVFIAKDGHVKILDFGIAKLTRPEAGADPYARTLEAAPSTDSGAVLGTMGYISPEQLRGQPADARSDIFSFGCVLYEMLSGRSPFLKGTGAETVSAILNEDPRPLAGSGREIPPALQENVNRCLEKRPEDRFSSAHDLALALRAFSGAGETPVPPPIGLMPGAERWVRRRWPAVAGIATVLIAAAMVLWLWKGKPAKPGPDVGPKRIAVLPFENLGAAEDAYFADGMTDEVRGKLAGLSGLAVIARSSTDQYKGSTKPVRQISEELEVPYLLTAKIRWQKGGPGPSRVRVTPELVEVAGAAAPITRWQDSFDAELQDVFRVQTEIATRVAVVLDVMLASQEKQRLEQRPTSNLAAYDAYLRGREISGPFVRVDLPSLRRAITQYEQAVALDPSFALAWVELSRQSTLLYLNGVPSPSLAERAREAAERALRLAPELPEARLAMGLYDYWVERDFAKGGEEYQAGLAVSPHHAGLIAVSALAELTLGRWDDALAHLEQARSLDPRSAYSTWLLGRTLLRLRRYPEALSALDRALALDPSNDHTIGDKAGVFLGQGDLAGARAVVSEALKRTEPTILVAALALDKDLGWVLDESQQQLLLSLTPATFDDDRAIWGLVLARTYALRGDMVQARRFAEEAHGAYVKELAQVPEDARLRANHGLALAYLGQREEAIREGKRGVVLLPITRDAYSGPAIQHKLVRIYIILGDHEKALDLLEPLLRIPYVLSPGWLSIDPTFAPLRGNPRFEKLLKPNG